MDILEKLGIGSGTRHARNSDPDTSHNAAGSWIDAKRSHLRNLVNCLHLIGRCGVTNDEFCNHREKERLKEIEAAQRENRVPEAQRHECVPDQTSGVFSKMIDAGLAVYMPEERLTKRGANANPLVMINHLTREEFDAAMTFSPNSRFASDIKRGGWDKLPADIVKEVLATLRELRPEEVEAYEHEKKEHELKAVQAKAQKEFLKMCGTAKKAGLPSWVWQVEGESA